MGSILHHRWVVADPDAAADPSRVVWVLHGALGSGQNFRRFIQNLAKERPDHRYLLVDLRCHGDSTGAVPPHTLDNCANDLKELAADLGVFPCAVLGHSFGGKVALQYAKSVGQVGALAEALGQVWLLDSVPGAQPGAEDSEVSHVIRAVRRVPIPAVSRRDVVEHLTSVEGLSSGLAEWMATNLRREGSEYTWRFDLDGIEELMADYFRVDLWDYLAESHEGLRIELVVAERSSRWTQEQQERVKALSKASQTRLHLLENSGHWVHVDNPTGLLTMLAEHLV